MSKKEYLTLWPSAQRTAPAEQGIKANLVITPETQKSIREAFSCEIDEDSVKAFKTPLDNDSLAKLVC